MNRVEDWKRERERARESEREKRERERERERERDMKDSQWQNVINSKDAKDMLFDKRDKNRMLEI